MPFSLLSFLQDPETKANVAWSMKYFSQGDTIVEEGSIGQEVFLITRGTVHIYGSVLLANDQIKDKGIAKLIANQTFGELSIFDNDIRSASAIAATDCEIAVIDGAALQSYMDANPEKGYPVLNYFFKIIAHRMRGNNIRANTIFGFYLRESAA